jgi:diguanylate cyclase (GGDEF)-like protein/PAS domain S-box-containing protein
MADVTAVRSAASGGADEAAEPHGLSNRAIGGFVAAGTLLSVLSLALSGDAGALVHDAISVIAAAGAFYGIHRNRPDRRRTWELFAFGLALIAAGDVTYDIAVQGFGRVDGYPFADILYLASYPVLAIALLQLTRSRFDRATLIDSALVAVALSAVLWYWVITPVLDSSTGSALQRLITVAYPLMDILLLVVIVHAVFTLPRWTAAAMFLFLGLTLMLVADSVYARLVADNSYVEGTVLDALWPISYFLLAAAVMHPSMRHLWEGKANPARRERARMFVLGAALFAAPAVVLLDDRHSNTSLLLALITGLAALAVAWRIVGVVAESHDARAELSEREARFRALVQHSADVVVIIDGDGVMQYVSPSIEPVFRTSAERLIGQPFMAHVHEGTRPASERFFRWLTEHPDETLHTEFEVPLPHGSIWIEATWSNQMDEPAVRGYVGNLRDITVRKRALAFSNAEKQILEKILSGAPVPDTLSELVHALEAFVPDGVGSIRLLDADRQALQPIAAPTLPAEFIAGVGRIATFEDANRHLNAPDLAVIENLETEGPYAEINALSAKYGLKSLWTLPICSPDGATMLGLLACYVKRRRQPRSHERVILERVRDLTALAIDRDAHTRELGRRALHDTLTGLPNRALAHDRIEHALERLGSADADSCVAVLFVDLDRFKLVNDGMGHEIGDELLIAVSRRLMSTVRSQDTVARIGGDEFLVLCEDLTDEDQAIELAERATKAFADPFVLSRAELAVSASIGIAVTGRSSERAANLLQDADAAMYRAKRRGGARYELFDDAMQSQAVSRALTERALRRALDRDELRVVFQPEFDLATGRRVAVEALLRWDHPVRGLVMPGEFLRVAEDTGVIVPMGAWVLSQACEAAQASADDEHPLTVSTNVSARQLQRPDFPEMVGRIVGESGVDPTTLRLEVAESVLLDDLDAMGDALCALKDIGLQIAIDDFGTGGSSLTYLRRFPVDELKIDQMFVEGLGRSATDDAIVAATIDIAHALDMIVAAEGVETEAQRLRLIEFGCDRAQGFHLGMPEPLPPPRLVLVQQQPA